MKNIVFLLFLLPILAFSETPDTSKIPSSWKNESVIILNYAYRYDLKTSNYYTTSYGEPGKDNEKLKISYLVRDKWGVDELSQLSLPSEVSGASLSNKLGTIYKKSGKTIDLTKEHLIINELTMDFSFRGKIKNWDFLKDNKEKTAKLAVPNLEAGDMLEIDIEFETRSSPGFIILQNQFPILHANYEVNINNNSSSYYYTAPSLRIEGKYINCNYSSSSAGNTWSLQTDSVEKAREEILNDDLRQIPYVAFEYFSQNSRVGIEYTEFDAGEDDRKELQTEFIKKLYDAKGKQASGLASKIKSSLKKKHPTIKDTLAYIKDAFYLYREMDLATVLYGRASDADDELFAVTMTEVFFDSKIPFRVFMTQPDRYGEPTTLHALRERTIGIAFPSRNVYLFHPKFSFEPGSIPSYFENQRVVTFTMNKHYKKAKFRWWPFWTGTAIVLATSFNPVTLALPLVGIIGSAIATGVKNSNSKKFCKYNLSKKLNLGSDSASSNRIDNIFNLKIEPGKGTEASIEKANLFYGKMKNSEARDLYYYSSAYYQQENPYRKLLGYTNYTKNTAEEDKEEKELITKRMKNEILNDELEVKDFTSYTIDEANLFDKDKPLKYSQNFTLKNFCWTNGDYMIVDAGKLIGGQLNVPDNGKERTQDFNIPYRKQFNNTINIPLPEGYQAENLSEFNFNVTTAAGAFVSSAKMEGNKIVITTSKTYQFLTYEKNKANDVYNFLKEAEKFRNRKLILRKK